MTKKEEKTSHGALIILIFSKGITRSFMLSALTFWMDYFHIDGYRIDAVSYLIYYLGNKNEGVNHDAINFLRQLSYHLFGKDDRFLFMAEDSTIIHKSHIQWM